MTLALENVTAYDEKRVQKIEKNEETVDNFTDALDNYLVKLAPHLKNDLHNRIMDQYYKVNMSFERLSDYGENICDASVYMHENKLELSAQARAELDVVTELLDKILGYTRNAFLKRDIVSAQHIEPLEEVMDDLTNALHDNHLNRLREGSCSIQTGTKFLDILSNLESISDTCSDVGVATIARVHADIASKSHYYISSLHQGNDKTFNEEYNQAHEEYFEKLKKTEELKAEEVPV